MTWADDGHLHLGVGIEDTFVPQTAPGHRALDEYELTGHYENWQRDLGLVAESGATLLRWGIPWYRIEYAPGRFDWSWTDRVADELERLGLTCLVDLMHYGTPLWLEDGFLADDYPERVAEYAARVADRYASRWTWFTPLNEPVLNAYNCGQLAMWPPYLSDHDGFVRVLLQLCRGMVGTQKRIAETNPAARFLHVDAGLLWDGETTPESRDLLEERRFAALELIMGRVREGHALHAYLRRHGAGEADLEWFQAHAVSPDVIGVNYYPAISKVTRIDGRETPLEAGIDGLRELLGAYRHRYDGPFALTETSREADGPAKAEWLAASLRQVEGLRSAGMDIAAYIWFPFLGLFDWNYRYAEDSPDEWWMPMGLVDLRRTPDGRLERIQTTAFMAFQEQAARLRGS